MHRTSWYWLGAAGVLAGLVAFNHGAHALLSLLAGLVCGIMAAREPDCD